MCVCVCVCVCARARACVCVCVCIFHHVKASALEPYFIGNMILFGSCHL